MIDSLVKAPAKLLQWKSKELGQFSLLCALHPLQRMGTGSPSAQKGSSYQPDRETTAPTGACAEAAPPKTNSRPNLSPKQNLFSNRILQAACK